MGVKMSIESIISIKWYSICTRTAPEKLTWRGDLLVVSLMNFAQMWFWRTSWVGITE